MRTAGDAIGQQLAPALRGRRVLLRAVLPADFEFLYRLNLESDIAVRWRHRGATPSPEQFIATLWQGVVAQYIIEELATSQPIGQVYLHRVDTGNATGYAAVAVLGSFARRGFALEAGGLFLDHVFKVWNLRKIYAESLDFNYSNFATGAGRYFREEGRLGEHEYHDGRYWDLVILALYREEWMNIRPLLERWLTSGRAEPMR